MITLTIVFLVGMLSGIALWEVGKSKTEGEELDRLRQQHTEFTTKYRKLYEDLVEEIIKAGQREAEIRTNEASAVIGKIAAGSALDYASIGAPRSVSEIENQIRLYTAYAGYDMAHPEKIAEAIAAVVPADMLRQEAGVKDAN